MENKLNKKYQYGWYGTCDEECTSKFLDGYIDRKYIESIIRVSLVDGKSFEKFTAPPFLFQHEKYRFSSIITLFGLSMYSYPSSFSVTPSSYSVL